MASFYVKQISSSFSDGGFILGGLSFGANMAVEVARQLGNRYKNPIVMLDGWAYYPDIVYEESHLYPYLDQYFQLLHDYVEDVGKEIILPDGFSPMHLKRAKYLKDYKMSRVEHDILLFKAQETPPVLQPIDTFDNHWSGYANNKLKMILI